MKKRILFIINPKSGDRKKGHLQDLVNKHLPSDLFETRLDFTTHAGHAKELAQNGIRENWHCIVAAGGDGTINEVASQLIGSEAALGIIPYGSGNGFARHLGIHLNDEKAVQQLASNVAVKIDVGFVNDHPFFCTSGVGFDSLVGEQFEKMPERGLRGYVRTVWREIRAFNGLAMEIAGKNSESYFLFTAANAGQFGNNAWIAPHADIADGKLEFCTVKPFPLWKLPLLGFKLLRRTIHQSRYYSSFPESECRVKLKEAFPFHADGEIKGVASEIHWRVQAAGLWVMKPK
jgi:YegS/Rv2252/BmrU family lipid kinase